MKHFRLSLFFLSMMNSALAQIDNPYSLAFDTSRNIIYCATNSAGIIRSVDNGSTWSRWNNGLDTGGIVFVTSMVYVPGGNSRVIANAHLSGARGSYLMEHREGSSGWQRIQTPVGWDYSNSFAVSDSRVWIAGNASGLWLYDTEFSTWQNRTPFQDSLMTHVALTPSDTASVWSASMFLANGFLKHHVNKSNDNGVLWTRMRDSVRGVLKGLYIDPNNSNHVIIVDRMFRETFDGGTSWPRSTAPDTNTAWIYSTAIDWVNNRWYSATESDSIYVSTDQGISWSALPLAGGTFITDIILHPKDHCHIYVLKVDGLHESTDCGKTWLYNPLILSTPRPEAMTIGFEIVALYPYPITIGSSASYLLHIRSERQSSIRFRIFDVLCELRYEQHEEFFTNTSKTMTLPFSMLESGTFFLTVDDGQHSKTLPLIILR